MIVWKQLLESLAGPNYLILKVRIAIVGPSSGERHRGSLDQDRRIKIKWSFQIFFKVLFFLKSLLDFILIICKIQILCSSNEITKLHFLQGLKNLIFRVF